MLLSRAYAGALLPVSIPRGPGSTYDGFRQACGGAKAALSDRSRKSQPENAPGHVPTWNTCGVTMVNRMSVIPSVAPLSVTSFI